MELKGRIKFIGQTLSFGNNGFRKRELAVTTSEQYPQDILVEFVQDKCDILNHYAVGQEVSIGINLKGREWTNPLGETKYFNTIQGWKINLDLDSSQQSQQASSPPPENSEPVDNLPEEETDDLPF